MVKEGEQRQGTYPHLLLGESRVKCRGILHGPVQGDLLQRRGKDEVRILNQDVADLSPRPISICLIIQIASANIPIAA